MGLSLFFLSQGAGAVGWPVVATACRFAVTVGGGWYAGLLLRHDLGSLSGQLAHHRKSEQHLKTSNDLIGAGQSTRRALWIILRIDSSSV